MALTKARSGTVLAIALALLAAVAASTGGTPAAEPEEGALSPAKAVAEKLLNSGSVREGLCIHLGCGDGLLTAELCLGGKYVVHGLTSDREELEKTRQYIRSRGLYGRISVDCCSMKRLPYGDSVANVIVIDDLPALEKSGLATDEIVRVLAPYGVAFLKGTNVAVRDATVSKIGEWTKVVKPYPKEMDEWQQDGHDASGLVQSNDQLVGPPTMPRWINGATWGDGGRSGSFASANGRVFYRHLYSHPFVPTRVESPLAALCAYDAFNGYQLWTRDILWSEGVRPIAAGDRVYTLLPDSQRKLVALDAATGETVLRYEFVATTDLRLHHGILLNNAGTEAWDAATGKSLWRLSHKVQHTPEGIMGLGGRWCTCPFVVDEGGRLFCVAGDEIVCSDLGTGQRKWVAPLQSKGETEGLAGTGQGVILTLENTAGNVNPWNDKKAEHILRVYSAADGGFRWEIRDKGLPNRLLGFFGNELVVCTGDRTVSLDLVSGNEQRGLTTAIKPVEAACVPVIQTSHWVMGGDKSRNLMLDSADGRFFSGSVVRGSCQVGAIPANGLLYQGLNTCDCLHCTRGDAAFAADPVPDPAALSAEQRLERGPAFGRPSTDGRAAVDDWPVFRHDALRHNSTAEEVPVQLVVRWHAEFTAAPSGATVAGKQAFCALPETHDVCALDTTTGARQWIFTASARVDTPPTFHRGRVVFGAHDGWLYCLDAATGELAWRYLVAPADQRLLVRSQLESPWPLFGSPLIDEAGVVFTSAGRNSESGGGIYCAAIDLATGEPRWQSKLGPVSVTTNPANKPFRGYTANNDLLLSDGSRLLFQKYQIDPATGKVTPRSRPKPPAGDELVPGTLGLMDEAYLTNLWWGALAKMLPHCRDRMARAWCLDEKDQWALGRTGDTLGGKDPIEDSPPPTTQPKSASKDPDAVYFVSGTVNGERWLQRLPPEAQAKAILHAGSAVYVSAVVDAPGGAQGILCRFDATTGAPGGTVTLPSPPVFEGLSVGHRSVFVATQAALYCLGE